MAGSKDIATQIYEDISQKILSLEYEPGMSFSENDICEKYNASRTPVRSAMQRLADKGLIDLLPYQKTRVSKINLERVKQLVYARSAIEDRVIKDFIKIDDLLLIEDVEHLIRKQQIVLNSDETNISQFYELDAKMHRLWFEAVNAIAIWDFFQSSIHYTRQRKVDIVDCHAMQVVIEEHNKILQAIRDKNTECIYDILHNHLFGGVDRVSKNSELAGYFA